MPVTTPANQEAVEAWDGVLFDRFVKHRDILVAGLKEHGDKAMERFPPEPGQRVLDIGCGFGDTTRQLAELVGPGGSAVGLDAAPRFIAAAREENADVDNAEFVVADPQAGPLQGEFDYVFSRFGTMFFANPVVALRNVRAAMAPGAFLCMVVWRQRTDNDWVHRGELIARRYLDHPDETDEPTCGPGPFSMAGADTTSDVLLHAGFRDIALRRSDMPLYMGPDPDAATEVVMAVGPAAELVRINGERAEPVRERIETEIRAALAEYETPRGIEAPSSTWVVTALNPRV